MDLIWLTAGVVPLGAGAFATARAWLGRETSATQALAAFVLAWAALTLGAEVLGTLGRLDRPALVAWSAGMGALGGGLGVGLRRRRSPTGEEPPVEPTREGRLDAPALVATIVVLWTALRLGIVSLCQPVKVVSDGPIYHLYFAARWWQAGRIEAVASPFGEAGATYFWANGELWYAWLMTLWGGDRFAKVGQAPFFLISGLAVAALARTLGAGASAARLAAAWFVALSPFLLFSFEPNVDAILVAGYLLAAFFFVRAFVAAGPVDAKALVLGALAAGLGMGTKPTGIVFFPPVLALASLGALIREARTGRRGRAVLLGGAVPLLSGLMMAYWPIRNALWTGNPLYPLHVAVGGHVFLAGWFGPGAMEHSPYFIPRDDLRALGDILMSVVGSRLAPIWLAAALGTWAIGRQNRSTAGPTPDRWITGLTILGLLNLAAYWLVIPYRTQQRFCLPGFALLAIPLARLLDRSAGLRWVAVVLLAVHLLTPEGWPFGPTDAAIPWDLTPNVPNARPAVLVVPTDGASYDLVGTIRLALSRSEVPEPVRWTLATTLLGLGALGAALLWDSARAGGVARSIRLRALALALLAPLGLGAAWAVHAFDSIPFPGFVDFLPGWLALDRLTTPTGARIAYAGHKIPYYLMGSRLQNRVQYVNVDEHRDWLMHDYHRAAPGLDQPATWPNPFPGWDRLRPRYDAWLANLRARRIDFLVVTRANAEEGGQNFDTEGFPIERVWADRHPGDFRARFGPQWPGTQIRIYEVLPAPILRENATDRAARSH